MEQVRAVHKYVKSAWETETNLLKNPEVRTKLILDLGFKRSRKTAV